MIIEQEISIHDRHSLEVAREHLRKKSALELMEISSHYHELRNKWTISRLGYVMTKTLIAKSMGSGLGTLIASLAGSHKSTRGKSIKGWKLMLSTAFQKTLASLIRKFV